MKIPRNAEETIDKLFDPVTKKTFTQTSILDKNIVFHFTDEEKLYTYHIHTDTGNPVINKEWTGDSADLEIACSVTTWMKICRKALNPVWAVISKKLKVKGDKSLLQIFSFEDRIPKVFPGMNDLPADYEYPRKRKWKLPKKALIVSASPRGSEGYTHLLLDRLVKGMQDAGVECNMVVLKDKNIHECTGCWKCWIVNNGTCVFNDDMAKVDKLYEESDLVVHGFPVYYGGMPALLKRYLERQVTSFEPYFVDGLYKVRHPNRKPKKRYLAVLSICGYSERSSFNAIEPHYKEICHNAHLGMTDFIFLPETSFQFNSPVSYDVASKKLQLLETAGYQLAQKGKVNKRVLKELAKTLFPPRKIKTWMKFANLSWSVRLEKEELDY